MHAQLRTSGQFSVPGWRHTQQPEIGVSTLDESAELFAILGLVTLCGVLVLLELLRKKRREGLLKERHHGPPLCLWHRIEKVLEHVGGHAVVCALAAQAHGTDELLQLLPVGRAYLLERCGVRRVLLHVGQLVPLFPFEGQNLQSEFVFEYFFQNLYSF